MSRQQLIGVQVGIGRQVELKTRIYPAKLLVDLTGFRSTIYNTARLLDENVLKCI